MTQVNFQKPGPDGMKTRPGPNRVDRLASILVARLDEHELRLLCFQLGIDYYYLPGEEIHEKTRAMIAVLVQQRRIPELISTVLIQHPEIPWKKLLNLSRYPKWISRFSGSFNKLLPALILLSIIMALFAVIPLSSANWNEVLGITGEIFTGTWDDSDCTHSQGYWKEHPDAWPVDGITMGDISYSKEDALSVLDTPPQGDATYILVHQLMAAKLNLLNGAEPSFIEQTILDADGWLTANPLGSKPKNPERNVGIALAEVLEMYNTGEIGPGECGEEGGGNISSIASIFNLPPTGNDPAELDFSATPIGMLPELPGTPPTGDTPEQPQTTPYSSESEPPDTPEATQPAEPTLISLHTPTLAPTQDAHDGLTVTPEEGLSSTPTAAPTFDLSPTETGITEELPQPTPTSAPTAYAGPPGCTQPSEYWTLDPGTWSVDEFYFAEVEYAQEAALEILLANPQGDVTYILAKQYITAQLNIASPADPTAIIDPMDSVNSWFIIHPLGSAPKNPDRKEGLELASMLESYNFGLLGPGPCVQPSPTPTPTSTSTPENLSIPTLAPSPTPAATLEIPPTASTP